MNPMLPRLELTASMFAAIAALSACGGGGYEYPTSGTVATATTLVNLETALRKRSRTILDESTTSTTLTGTTTDSATAAATDPATTTTTTTVATSSTDTSTASPATTSTTTTSSPTTTTITAPDGTTTYAVDPGAFSGSAVSTAYVQRVEVVVSDASHGDRGNGWGGHQPRYTRHNDGTERLLYILGPYDGAARSWRLMKRTPSSGAWTQEAVGQTNNEAALIRDPATDTAHVIAYPGDKPTTYSPPAYAPVAIPGTWTPQGSAYAGIGIGPDGTLVIKNQFDQFLGGSMTKDTETHYIAGKFNGSSWAFDPVQKKYIGERYCYDYILPGAFGDSSQIVGVALRDVTKYVAGLPNISSSYVWDGVGRYSSGVASTTAWKQSMLMPKRTPPSDTTTTAAWMGIHDVFADSKRRLFTTHRVWDPAGMTGTYLTVSDSAGNVLHQGVIAGLSGGNTRIVEDAKNRLWLLENSQGVMVRLFRMSDTFTLGTPTDLSGSFTGYGYSGSIKIAAPRGGNRLGDSIDGYIPAGQQLVSFRIRLPN